MNTIAIDSNIYKGAESYAKLHNISVTAVSIQPLFWRFDR